MRTKNTTPFLFGATASSLRPPHPLMTLIVKGTFRLRPDTPVEPLTGIGEQGTLSGDVFDPSDEERTGHLLYASDFADFKAKTDILLRALCHTPGARPMAACPVRATAGSWSKLLNVVGRRVWTERVLGKSTSEPAPFTTMQIDYTRAFGGPEHPDNPVGLGVHTAEMHNIEAPGDIVRSKSDRIRPAGFGPISPFWLARRAKVGKQYGASWAARRAPYYAEDFDLSYFQSAPPDQQVEWLRGDEEMSFQNLHPASPLFSAKLPALRIRAFVRDDQNRLREVKMHLDTLLADLVDEKLILTWRGIEEVREDDLADVQTVLIASEPLGEEPRAESLYADDLAAFERDPLGIEAALPRPPPHASTGEEDEDPLLRRLEPELGDLMPADRERIRRSVRRLTSQKAPGVDLRAAIAKALSAPPAAPPRILPPTQPGAAPAVRLGDLLSKIQRAAERLTGAAAAQGQPLSAETKEKLAALEKHPALARHGAGARSEGKDEPGPGADLSGRDLSGQDLSGRDLTGANLEGAILQKTKLTKAILVRANLSRAVLTEADLEGADMTEADLSQAHLGHALAAGAVLRRAKLDQTVFQSTALPGADLTRATGKYAVFQGAALNGAKLPGVALEQSLFDEADLEKADFKGAVLRRCRFSKCAAQSASFEGASLSNTGFADSDLSRAVLRDAKGERAVFIRATLTGADLDHAVLPDSHFTEAKADKANLTGADLRGARFYRASLHLAVLDGVNLLYADLRKADLRGTSARGSNLYAAKLQHARRQGLDLTGANVQHVFLEARE
jgi:uncharacterized protein YjbI with pentapeptide repeats